jgi:transposase
MGHQQRRQFSPEFKRDAVQLVRSSGRTIADVARELGCGETSLNGWITQGPGGSGGREPGGVSGGGGRVGRAETASP